MSEIAWLIVFFSLPLRDPFYVAEFTGYGAYEDCMKIGEALAIHKREGVSAACTNMAPPDGNERRG